MQRTNRLLKKRKGFVLIVAVFMMLAISFLLLRMIGETAEGTQRTINNYIHQQAILLTYAATEEAVLAVSGRNREANGCIRTITGQFPANNPTLAYTTQISYIWSNDQTAALNVSASGGANCFGYIDGNQATANQLNTNETGGSMLVDVYVSDHVGIGLDEPIQYHRRTLQKL